MSNQPTIEFVYDFGSPNAYLVHLVVPELEQRLGTEVQYVPVLLGGVFNATGNVSPAVSVAPIKNKFSYMNLETERFVNKHNLKDVYHFNPHFPVNTLTLMRITVAVQDDAAMFKRVNDCFFNAMWLEPKKMDEPEVIAEALTAADLPAKELLESTQDPAVKQKLIDATAAAVDRGVFGAPSFFVGDELYFGKDKLREVEEEFLSQSGATS